MILLPRLYKVSLSRTVPKSMQYMRPHSPGVLCPLTPAPTSQHNNGHTNASFDLIELANT